MYLSNERIVAILKENGFRITNSRMAVITTFTKNSNAFFTPEEVYRAIQKDKEYKCDQASVYRILTALEELSIVKKSEFHKDASRYSLNDIYGDTKAHEHYFKCTKCYTIESFSDCLISKKEKELEKRGYKQLHHHLEITGVCPNCA